MEDVTTIEGNKIIAEFMGWYEMSHTKSRNWMLSEVIDEISYAKKECSLAQMKFSSSWDWLMPVVKKFIDIHDIKESRDRNIHSSFCNRLHNTVTDYSIKPVFNVLAEAIQWYNTQHPQSKQTV